MRAIVADWGTTRFRGFLLEGGRVLDRVATEEGVSAVAPGGHAAVFARACGAWLEANPDAPVLLVGMVGSREGWVTAPYAACPAGAAEIAGALAPVEVAPGRAGHIVPGLSYENEDGIDVMRGEETLVLGTGVADGVVCLPGTHPKWIAMRGGRVERFATFLTGELYALLRHHSMVGRPATEPADPAGFALGLAAAGAGAEPALRSVGITPERRPSLLNLLFAARAAVVTGRLPPARLGPYLSGLLTGDEINGALALFGPLDRLTVVAGEERAGLYREALGARGIAVDVRDPEESLIAGLARLAAARDPRRV